MYLRWIKDDAFVKNDPIILVSSDLNTNMDKPQTIIMKKAIRK